MSGAQIKIKTGVVRLTFRLVDMINVKYRKINQTKLFIIIYMYVLENKYYLPTRILLMASVAILNDTH